MIESKLEQQQELVGRALDARVVGKQVTLTGTVKSEDDKALAERVAMVQGINQVNNLLEVQPDTGDIEPAAAQPRPGQHPGPAGRPPRAVRPYRKDPLVGTSPQERIVEREKMLRTMGMEDPKVKRQREQAAKNQNTMTPTDSPPANSDHPETGNQSAPPK